MNSIRGLHKKAMDTAEKAFVARLKGDLKLAKELYGQAYRDEAQAARLMPSNRAPEPTRSVLYRSAASLALNCGKFREARQLIGEGLAGNPPREIADELRALHQQITDPRVTTWIWSMIWSMLRSGETYMGIKDFLKFLLGYQSDRGIKVR